MTFNKLNDAWKATEEDKSHVMTDIVYIEHYPCDVIEPFNGTVYPFGLALYCTDTNENTSRNILLIRVRMPGAANDEIQIIHVGEETNHILKFDYAPSETFDIMSKGIVDALTYLCETCKWISISQLIGILQSQTSLILASISSNNEDHDHIDIRRMTAGETAAITPDGRVLYLDNTEETMQIIAVSIKQMLDWEIITTKFDGTNLVAI